jgi:hypothetical protein
LVGLLSPGDYAGYADEGRRLAVDVPNVTPMDAARFIAEATPIIGDAMAVKEIYDEATSENPNWALVGALGGAAVLGLFPGIGDAAAKAVKSGARGLLDTAKRVEVDPNAMGSLLNPQVMSPAQKVADLLASGRIDEVTDEMLGKLTPNDNMELFELYESGATGMDLPMDVASRMQRAAEQSMVPGYHGTIPNRKDDIYRSIDEYPDNPDIKEFDINRSTRGQSGKGIYFAPPHNIELANKFAQVQSANPERIKSFDPNNSEIKGVVYPSMVRANNQANHQQMRKAQYDYENLQREQGKSAGYSGLSDTVYDTLKPQGFSGVNQKHEFTTFSPENIRSQFARFDPRLAHLKNLSAGLTIIPGGLLALQEMQKRANEEQQRQGLLQ